jgi:hypothetical protein
MLHHGHTKLPLHHLFHVLIVLLARSRASLPMMLVAVVLARR